MKIHKTEIPEILIFEPKVFGDDRGFFLESYNQRVFADVTGHKAQFVQDNHSRSSRNVLRGLHYQIKQTQGKLVRVLAGSIYDVAVDIRRSSPTFRQWVGRTLTDQNHHSMWVPEGFAHGFIVLSDSADVAYKTTDYYAPEHERSIAWNDPELAVKWPLDGEPLVSERDSVAASFAEAELFE